jgi:SWI/SNF-related matrix-associated actin-dependent regulator of chromatin subfamily A member 5
MLRRIKEDTDLRLPKKTDIHLQVGLTQQQTLIYTNILIHKKPIIGTKVNKLNNILMQLRKACLHPYLFSNTEDDNQELFGEHLITESGKMIILDKLLKKITLKDKEKVLIFS